MLLHFRLEGVKDGQGTRLQVEDVGAGCPVLFRSGGLQLQEEAEGSGVSGAGCIVQRRHVGARAADPQPVRRSAPKHAPHQPLRPEGFPVGESLQHVRLKEDAQC